jgi:hypothetical protein
MKKTHKLILFLLAVYFCLAHVTSRLEISSLQQRSVQMETLLLQQARQQKQILANQEKSMNSGKSEQPWHPDTDGIPDLV